MRKHLGPSLAQSKWLFLLGPQSPHLYNGEIGQTAVQATPPGSANFYGLGGVASQSFLFSHTPNLPLPFPDEQILSGFKTLKARVLYTYVHVHTPSPTFAQKRSSSAAE